MLSEATTSRDNLTADEQRHLRKDFPATKDWPTFRGEGEYNHQDFIDWVDQTVLAFKMPDILVTSKLSIVLTGIAREWYIENRKRNW